MPLAAKPSPPAVSSYTSKVAAGMAGGSSMPSAAAASRKPCGIGTISNGSRLKIISPESSSVENSSPRPATTPDTIASSAPPGISRLTPAIPAAGSTTTDSPSPSHLRTPYG